MSYEKDFLEKIYKDLLETRMLEEKLVENRQVIRDAVEAAPEIVVREVTEEERQALRDGAMSR